MVFLLRKMIQDNKRHGDIPELLSTGRMEEWLLAPEQNNQTKHVSHNCEIAHLLPMGPTGFFKNYKVLIPPLSSSPPLCRGKMPLFF